MSILFGKTGPPGTKRLSEGGLSRPSGFNPWYPEFSYFEFDGTGDFLDSPDTADLDTISGDMEIHAEISNWSDTGATQFIYGRWNTSHAFFVGIANGGGLLFFTRDSSGTYRSVTSAEALPEEHIQVRVVFDRSESTVEMYYKRPYTPWIPLTGGTMDLSGNVIRVGSDEMSAGAQASGNEPFTGRIHQARVWKNIVGSGDEIEIAAWTADDYVAGTTFTSGTDTPRVWTLVGDTTHTKLPAASGSFQALLNESIFAMLAEQHQGGAFDDPSAYRGSPYLGLTADTSDSNDAEFMPHDGDNYWFLPSDDENYFSVADTAVLDITGDLDLRCDILADDYTTGAERSLVSKFENGTHGYMMFLTGGDELRLRVHDGSAKTSGNTGTSLTDGQRYQLRATLDASTGEVITYFRTGSDIQDLTSDDDWTQISTNSDIGAVTIGTGTDDLFLGRSNASSRKFSGRFYGAEVRSGIAGAGTTIALMDSDDAAMTGQSWTGTVDGLSWVVTYNTTVNQDKMLFVDRPMWYQGGDDWITMDPTLFPTGASDVVSFFIVKRWMYGGSDFVRWFSIGNPTGEYVSLDMSATEETTLRLWDGATAVVPTRGPAGTLSGDLIAAGAVIDFAGDDDAELYVPSLGLRGPSSTAALTTGVSPADDVYTAQQSSGGDAQGGIVAVMSWNRVLTEAEFDTLRDYFGVSLP